MGGIILFVRLAMLLNHDIVNPNLEGFVFILADFETEALEVGPCEREHHFARVLCVPVNTGIAEELQRNAEVFPFGRNFTKALGTELNLEVKSSTDTRFTRAKNASARNSPTIGSIS